MSWLKFSTAPFQFFRSLLAIPPARLSLGLSDSRQSGSPCLRAQICKRHTTAGHSREVSQREKKEDNLTTETESGKEVEVRLIPKGLTGGCPGRRTKAKAEQVRVGGFPV